MRKKVTICLILVLSVLLTLSLAACNAGAQDVDALPDNIGAGDVNQNNNGSGNVNAYLKFSMPEKASSVFSSIYVDEFDVSDVKYSIVYTDGKTTTEVNGGDLTQDMIVAEDRPLLEKAGHHMIRVATTLSNGSEVKGSFALHLKDRYVPTPQVTLTFVLEQNVQAFFGKTENGKVSVQVDQGITFESWYDFTDAFRMTCTGKALNAVKYSGNTLSATSGFGTKGFTINSNIEFTPEWTANVYNVELRLNKPADATVQQGKEEPKLVSSDGDSLENQSVVRGTGKIQSPVVDKFNVFNGYYFAGWYKDVDGDGVWSEKDTLWSFAQTVSSDTTLVARWTRRSYSFTLYTMGGVYPQGVKNSVIGGKEIKSDKDVPNGYTLINATSRFGLEEKNLNRLVIDGFAYEHNYAEYIIKVVAFDSATDKQREENTRYFTFTDLTAKLVKGSNDYVTFSGIYKDYQCTNIANVEKIEADENGVIDDIGYVKWVFNEPEKPGSDATEAQLEAYRKARLQRLSGYYTDVVFKGGLTVKADGSIRIDKIADESVSELIIPATLIVNGKECPITQISARSCMNLKALLKLDMSEASNLTSIGEQAFAHCPVLSEVSFPTSSSMKEMGKNVFYRSVFENKYKENNNTDFFIVNDILYKYVGNGDEFNIDLSQYNIATIADGAFANRAEITSVTLGENVARINNGAFEGCVNLENLTVPSNSKLYYIGETAFEDCDKLLSSSSNIYNSDYTAIIIAKVYYRFLGEKNATSATIPTATGAADAVNYIAAKAFDGYADIVKITISWPTNIIAIGKDAFNSTEWIRTNGQSGGFTNDGFTVINGILVAYYNQSIGAASDIVLPDDIATINEDAFGTFANQVATIQFSDKVQKIDDYAFVGASSLVSLILHKVDVDETANKLVGIPEIAEYAFAGSNGKLIDSLRFFFREEVIQFFKSHVDDAKITDKATIGWLQLYKQYSTRFITEDITDVWIDNTKMSDKILRTSASDSVVDAMKKAYGSNIANALVVISNTKVTRFEDLDFTINQVGVTAVSGENNKYIITFKYDNSEKGCHITENSENKFVVEVIDAINSKDITDFFETNGAFIDANGKTNKDAFWIEGFVGDVEGALAPTFYTSTDVSGIKVKFGYRDIFGDTHYIDVPVKNIEKFSTSKEKHDTAEIAVDFYGLGTYKFSIEYIIVESKFNAIEQTSEIAIPINGDAKTYFNNFKVNMIGEDGIIVQMRLNTSLSDSGFEVLDVDGKGAIAVDTATLGLHTLKIKYSKKDAISGGIQQTIVYSVVLEADASLFGYEIIDENAKTARIISCKATSAETIVLPTTYTAKDGTVYNVTDIGRSYDTKGVFEGFKYLKAIYLAKNIVNIMPNSFSGCTALENVYTAQRVDDENAQLTSVNFDVVRTTETETEIINYVDIVNLQGVTYDGTLVIGAEYVVAATEMSKKIVYKVIGIGKDITVNAGTEVFLPDTVYRYNEMAYKTDVEGVVGTAVAPYVYTSANGIKFKTVQYVGESVEYIGNNAFSDCTSLKTIDLSRATALEYIGTKAFYNSGLESIDLSANIALKAINGNTFENCANLKSVKVCSLLEAICTEAFKNCSNLEKFEFSDSNGLKSIGANAFFGCTKEGFVAPKEA